jgi:hypothetical protein
MSSLRLELQTINHKLDSHGSGGDLRGKIDEMKSLVQSLEPKAQASKSRALQVKTLVKLDVEFDEEQTRPIKTKLVNSTSALQTFLEVWNSDPLTSRQSAESSLFNRSYSNLETPFGAFIENTWIDWVELRRSEFRINEILTNPVQTANHQQSNISEYKRFLGRFEQLTTNIPISTQQIEELISVIDKLKSLHSAIISDPGINVPAIVKRFFEEADRFTGRGFQFNDFTDELWNWLKKHQADLDGYTIKRR